MTTPNTRLLSDSNVFKAALASIQAQFSNTITNNSAIVVSTAAATSVSINGSMSQTAVTSAFTPQLGRNMYLTLSGTWTGSVRVERSVDGGQTWNAITVAGGQPWLVYSGNCDESIETPSDANGIYRLDFVCTSGTLNYRLAQ